MGQTTNLFKFLDSKSKFLLVEQCISQQIVPLHHTRNKAVRYVCIEQLAKGRDKVVVVVEVGTLEEEEEESRKKLPP